MGTMAQNAFTLDPVLLATATCSKQSRLCQSIQHPTSLVFFERRSIPANLFFIKDNLFPFTLFQFGDFDGKPHCQQVFRGLSPDYISRDFEQIT